MRLLPIIFLLLTTFSYAQKIQEIFKALPSEFTPGLTQAGKDSLMNFGNYIIPGGDSIETMACAYWTDSNEYISLEYNFTTGQRGFFIIEMRAFTKKNSENIVVYSKYGGTNAAYDQHLLKVFNYSQNKLSENKTIKLPLTIEGKEFIKKDSLTVFGHKTFSSSYNLQQHNVNGIEYLVDSRDASIQNLLETRCYLFTWNGKKFIKSKRF